jgi:hypothetical protein
MAQGNNGQRILKRGDYEAFLEALGTVRGRYPFYLGTKELGSDHAKPLLFQGLFARERGYFALEPHFPYRNGRL